MHGHLDLVAGDPRDDPAPAGMLAHGQVLHPPAGQEALVEHALVVPPDLGGGGALVPAGIQPSSVDGVGAERQRVHAVKRRRLMEPAEVVGVVPVAARRVPAVHQDDARIRVGHERVGERHPHRTAPDDEVVGSDAAPAHGCLIPPTRRGPPPPATTRAGPRWGAGPSPWIRSPLQVGEEQVVVGGLRADLTTFFVVRLYSAVAHRRRRRRGVRLQVQRRHPGGVRRRHRRAADRVGGGVARRPRRHDARHRARTSRRSCRSSTTTPCGRRSRWRRSSSPSPTRAGE